MKNHLTVKREGEFEYQIVWENDFSMLSSYIQPLNVTEKKACIVTDSNVQPLFAEVVTEQLFQVFDTVTVFTISAGEENKHLDSIKQLYTHLIEHRFDRKDILIALGGGVIGDLTGFAAATYLRGVDFIQIPTTLLAQVDSSIGGKTGVDFDQYKNMVGAFHQPRLVYMNMAALQTLSDEQFCCGIGEILKSGLIKNAEYFKWMLEHSKDVLARKPEMLISMIQESCRIKKNVVENDPTEQGERALLNLGHTVGHAIEKLADFKMPHGQCVAIGTVAAAYLSYQKGYLSKAQLEQIEFGNQLYHLPLKVGGLSMDAILTATKSDKKMEQGRIKFILLTDIGRAVIDKSITDDELQAAIAYVAG